MQELVDEKLQFLGRGSDGKGPRFIRGHCWLWRSWIMGCLDATKKVGLSRRRLRPHS